MAPRFISMTESINASAWFGALSPELLHVIGAISILRTLADDYGALALLDHEGSRDGEEWIGVHILSTEHARGRPFQLSARA